MSVRPTTERSLGRAAEAARAKAKPARHSDIMAATSRSPKTKLFAGHCFVTRTQKSFAYDLNLPTTEMVKSNDRQVSVSPARPSQSEWLAQSL
jgi:hypothetical protein